jgi:hypothetical protein
LGNDRQTDCQSLISSLIVSVILKDECAAPTSEAGGGGVALTGLFGAIHAVRLYGDHWTRCTEKLLTSVRARGCGSDRDVNHAPRK